MADPSEQHQGHSPADPAQLRQLSTEALQSRRSAIAEQLVALRRQEEYLLLELLCRALVEQAPGIATARFVADEFENGYFFADSPTEVTYHTVGAPGDVARDDQQGIEIDPSLMADVADVLGPVGEDYELVVDVAERTWETR